MKKRPADTEIAARKKRKLIAGCQVCTPEQAGLSSEPLDRLCQTVHEEVHELGSLSGVAHLILVDGKCVFAQADGLANESGAKFELQTLCALHSCSKPLTVAAFLTLLDAGKVRLTDPIDKYLPYPERVLARTGGAQTRKVRVRPTLQHLLTMQAGLRHSDDDAYSSIVSELKKHRIKDLTSFCDALFKVPLLSEPGNLHYYSLAIDVLGRVCEVVSGRPLDVFVTESLLRPLGMLDTHFIVPSSKLRRTAELYDCRRSVGSRSKPSKKPYCAHPWHGPQMHPGVFSGGGGILSYSDAGMYGTAEDYARFCQMLINGGCTSNGRRILRKSTVQLLFRDCLTPFASSNGRVRGWDDYGGSDPSEKHYWEHHAWSLLNATLDLEERPRILGPPRKGHTLWMYGMGAYWFVDARRKLVAISFAQCFSSRSKDRGSDCVPFAKEAFDKGPAGKKLKIKKAEKYYGKLP